MGDIFQSLAARFWPELKNYNEPRRLVGTADVLSFLYSLPLAVIGLVWLVRVSDWHMVLREWKTFLLLAVLLYIFTRIDYFIIFEIRPERYGSAKGSLTGMVQWTAVLLYGATTLWLSLIGGVLQYLLNTRTNRSIAAKWDIARNLSHDIAAQTLAYLIALSVYQRLGGQIPIRGLEPRCIVIAMAAIGVHFLVYLAIWSVYIGYGFYAQYQLVGKEGIMPLAKFLFLAIVLPNLTHPFAIQGAAINVQHGPLVFLFFISGLFLIAVLARQLSWTAESNRQRSRQLEMLESLSRAIINSPPDASLLAHLLDEHAPAMLPSARVAIYLSPDQMLVKRPPEWELDFAPIWEWSCMQSQSRAFLAKDPLPWQSHFVAHDPVVVTPILDIEKNTSIGCIYVELRSLAQPWDMKSVSGLMPGLKTLADQIASAIHQAQVYQETLTYQRTAQELKFAGRIQSSLLPDEIPSLDGWELAVTMLPARETSGDFFDFIPLPDNKIGILIADVADKGVPAALYMALCRTLIRTYAVEYVEAAPDVVFFAVNERLLKDARINLFVTAFYGILDADSGLLTYCNAGHNPPYWLSQNGTKVTALAPTGMPLGIEEETVWKLASIQMKPGDCLIIYTDGIPDAHNAAGEFYREKRLVEAARSHLYLPPQEMMLHIIDEIQSFVGEQPQFDDITLLILRRNPLEDSSPPSD
ncbi:MAG: PP2C family protein-serine/threonine phosphatase [Chloroflexota bacterium]